MAPSRAEAASGGRFRDLTIRAVSAAVLAPLALAAVWFGFPWYDLMVALAAVAMLSEWRRMAGGFTHPVWLASGSFYLVAAVVAALWLRHDARMGQLTILWVLAVVWATDIFAFFAGRAIGGPKLAPRISPGKTWSGLAGGMAAAAAASAVFSVWSAAPLSSLCFWGAATAVVAQAGDLLESAAKRRFGVKDSGTLIPGHGGILDRVDGLVAALLLVAIARLLGGGSVPW
ncbi:MAG: phosphatidate cytidylyltransferase [Rhodospirillales bacterium]|nr:phosphatidate cytidylyltransferase [Rhodospirillales bacterium]QQS12768.1 MAG: phosphatidate cytidylyltransferase [Rhodospirillales bacterium]